MPSFRRLRQRFAGSHPRSHPRSQPCPSKNPRRESGGYCECADRRCHHDRGYGGGGRRRKVSNLIGADPDRLYIEGVELAQSGRYAEALPYFEGAVDAKADFLDAWLYRGITLIQLGRFEDAIASLGSAADLSADQPDSLALIWTSKGKALSSLGRSDEAIASFDRVWNSIQSLPMPGVARVMCWCN
ncbi:MAG: tetratricopeptide repeat protein [Leptolyngbyaceae cyanobacterium SL_7_1]|nr:tetratricopeptide repeat protein [Leptolyngbyaceae cyanobacterium SL_7_1]